MTDTTLQEPTSNENNFPSVGQILKAARLERALTLEQISKILFIPPRQLSYLEEDAEHLVSEVYTLGFLKLYAEYLELNAQDITEKFKDQTANHPNSSQLIFPAPLPGRGMPSLWVVALSLLTLVAIILGWKWVNYASQSYLSINNNEAAVNIKDNPVSLPTEQTTLPEFPTNEEIAPDENIPSNLESSVNDEAVPPAALSSDLESPSQQVNLEITEKAWIEVKDKEGNIIVSRIFDPGESFVFKDSKNFILKTGNLKGTHLSSGEKVFPSSAKSGEVGQDIPLDPEKWLEQQSDTH